MPMLSPTTLVATVRYLGINTTGNDLSTQSSVSVDINYTGFVGDSHSGLTRQSCVRVKSQYPRGTEIRNTRQISALSVEQLNAISQDMRLDTLDPGWVGANLVV